MEDLISRLREERPLVHCITNIVVANFQANGLLALGVSPVMADAPEEVAEMASSASCTVLNIGTLHRESVESMVKAGRAANSAGNPVILNPVGAGATQFRKDAVARLLSEVDVTLIRCNAGELAAIAGEKWQASGVDAGKGDLDVAAVAVRLARENGCIVAVTGEKDILTDGRKTFEITGGCPLMARITGSGCLLSAVCGAFLTSGKEDPLRAAAIALKFYKTAGGRAAEAAHAPGSFLPAFVDQLSLLGDQDVDLEFYSLKEVRA